MAIIIVVSQMSVKEKIASTVKRIANIALTKEQRILRRDGWVDSCGEATRQARLLMGREIAEERFKTRGPELAKQLLKASKLEEDEDVSLDF
jgi:hypothetical protein